MRAMVFLAVFLGGCAYPTPVVGPVVPAAAESRLPEVPDTLKTDREKK